MNKKNTTNEEIKSNTQIDNTILENKEIVKSLDSQVNDNIIDNSNAYYSERYGWTLKKN